MDHITIIMEQIYYVKVNIQLQYFQIHLIFQVYVNILYMVFFLIQPLLQLLFQHFYLIMDYYNYLIFSIILVLQYYFGLNILQQYHHFQYLSMVHDNFHYLVFIHFWLIKQLEYQYHHIKKDITNILELKYVFLTISFKQFFHHNF